MAFISKGLEELGLEKQKAIAIQNSIDQNQNPTLNAVLIALNPKPGLDCIKQYLYEHEDPEINKKIMSNFRQDYKEGKLYLVSYKKEVVIVLQGE